MRPQIEYLLLILLSLWGVALAQPLCGAEQGAPLRAFRSGEELRYAVSYKVGLINTDVAEVNLRVKERASCYHITAKGTTLSLYKWFFDMNDRYDLWLDTQSLRPERLVAEIKEGDYRFSSRLDYDWEAMEAHSAYRNHKRADTTFKTLPLQVDHLDGLSHFYNLRCRYVGSFVEGRAEYINLVLEDTVRTLSFRYLGREQLRIKGLGRCRTLCFECELVTSNGESFEDGSRFKVWFSDDRNYIPLYAESPIRVGSIRVRLIHSSGLKYTPSYRLD